MKHLSSGTTAAILSLVGLLLAGAAAAQTPMSPSGAVKNSEPPPISFPRTSSGAPSSPPADAAGRPAAESAIPARSPASMPSSAAPGGPASSEAMSKPDAGTPGAENAAGRTVSTTEKRETTTVIRRPSRPKRSGQSANRDESQLSRSAERRGERYPGDNVADMLNARELSRMDGGPGLVPVPRPNGPPLRPASPPYVVGPVYGPPPGYGPPPYPPAMVRPPY